MSLDQEPLPLDAFKQENPAYLTDQLITYIGNKRSLLPLIDEAASRVQDRLGRKMTVLDAFSGSGVVSRLLKARSKVVIANDLEAYACVMSNCYLTNQTDFDEKRIASTIEDINRQVDDGLNVNGFIEALYAPKCDDNIKHGERVFYTRDNARRLDAYATLIHELDDDIRPFILAPLLSSASIHANTSGVFKGFYKDKETGVGRFGGSAGDALIRILGTIRLSLPVLSEYEADKQVFQLDANELPGKIDPVDLAYLDPPYNQHPYGSNYFMLNLLTEYEPPTEVSRVSGIPTDWNRSGYNVRKQSAELMRDLVSNLDAKFLLISFNDEGYIHPSEMTDILNSVGQVSEFQAKYNTFRGSRNLRNRNTHVTEHLFLVEKD